MQDIELAPTDTVDPAALHAAFTASFADYLIGPFTLPLAQWPFLLARQAADITLGRVALRDGHILAFTLVAPRDELGTWRLATMGAVPGARGTGVAPMLLDDFIQRAASAGMKQVELECFAQNERAIRLYRSRGFREVHPLYGYARAADAPRIGTASPERVQEVELTDAFAWLDAVSLALRDLPVQVTPPSLRAQGEALKAWRSGVAQIAFTSPSPEAVTVHSLVDRDSAQRDAQRLVSRLIMQYPVARIAVPQLQRPDLGGDALLRLGFEKLPLHQVLMRRPVE